MIKQTSRDLLRAFHEDEDGLEALQTIMIVAIAAVILIGLMVFGDKVFSWLGEKWDELKGKNVGG